jgi:hypothetical protein
MTKDDLSIYLLIYLSHIFKVKLKLKFRDLFNY